MDTTPARSITPKAFNKANTLPSRHLRSISGNIEHPRATSDRRRSIADEQENESVCEQTVIVKAEPVSDDDDDIFGPRHTGLTAGLGAAAFTNVENHPADKSTGISRWTMEDLTIRMKYWDTEILLTFEPNEPPRKLLFSDIWSKQPQFQRELLHLCQLCDENGVDPSTGKPKYRHDLVPKHTHVTSQSKDISSEDVDVINKFWEEYTLAWDKNGSGREVVRIGWMWEQFPEQHHAILESCRKYEQELKAKKETVEAEKKSEGVEQKVEEVRTKTGKAHAKSDQDGKNIDGDDEKIDENDEEIEYLEEETAVKTVAG